MVRYIPLGRVHTRGACPAVDACLRGGAFLGGVSVGEGGTYRVNGCIPVWTGTYPGYLPGGRALTRRSFPRARWAPTHMLMCWSRGWKRACVAASGSSPTLRATRLALSTAHAYVSRSPAHVLCLGRVLTRRCIALRVHVCSTAKVLLCALAPHASIGERVTHASPTARISLWGISNAYPPDQGARH